MPSRTGPRCTRSRADRRAAKDRKRKHRGCTQDVDVGRTMESGPVWTLPRMPGQGTTCVHAQQSRAPAQGPAASSPFTTNPLPSRTRPRSLPCTCVRRATLITVRPFDCARCVPAPEMRAMERPKFSLMRATRAMNLSRDTGSNNLKLHGAARRLVADLTGKRRRWDLSQQIDLTSDYNLYDHYPDVRYNVAATLAEVFEPLRAGPVSQFPHGFCPSGGKNRRTQQPCGAYTQVHESNPRKVQQLHFTAYNPFIRPRNDTSTAVGIAWLWYGQ
jgi:hypothetical protein